MSNPDFWKILIACIGFGAGGEALRQYRGFKARRRAIPRDKRNAGYWTDKRLYQAEALFCTAALCPPWAAAILLISANRPFWVTALILFLFPLSIYLLMRGMNMDEPQ